MFDQDIGLLPLTWRDQPEVKKGGGTLFWLTKRVLDVVLAVVALPFIAIVALVLLIVNPLFNPGSVFTVQTRVGQNGTPFQLLKFRTMTGAPGDARFATDENHRITGLGRFLRQRRIDEMPQFLNVLFGQMSVVGPRPEQPPFVDQYNEAIPRYRERHSVRPGITGLAQVEYGYTSDVMGTSGKLRYDLTYIRKSGFRLEAWLLWRTVVVMLTGFGAK